MRIVCISDTHNAHKGIILPDGDVLVHAGDATGQGLSSEIERFLDWFSTQPHPHKILVAGNHDWLFQRHPEMASQLLNSHPSITYLQDSGTVIDGVRFWGSPWQPWFCDWAFNLPRQSAEIREVWSQIPVDSDVVITHGPPHGVLDQVRGGHHLGCEELAARIAIVRPRLHIFGHIHDSFGVAISPITAYVNACTCDEDYRPTHRPIVVDLDSELVRVHGTEIDPSMAKLEHLMSRLDQAIAGESVAATPDLLRAQDDGLHVVAGLRGMSVEALIQDYISRGLKFDSAQIIRSGSRPSRRPIPVIKLEK